jgi:nitrate/TMAO reductase-like tetraheme cytochrome c subunit
LEDLGPLFVPPHSPDFLWVVVLIFALPTIALCLFTLIRGRLPIALSSSGLVLLPLFGYVLGDLHVLESSKSVEFCGSCHVTMPPLVESMQSEGKTLASVHFRQGAVAHESACYVCHSGYGIWGDVNAKVDGMNHMIQTILDSQRYPLEMRDTFDVASCLDCHAGSAPFQAIKGHRTREIQNQLLSGEVGCTGACHESAHPPAALNGTESWERWQGRGL